MSRPYAEVIGDPIAQSKSPLIHNFWLAKLGVAADYRARHVRGDALGEYFAGRRLDPWWRGCNVTMPHKLAVRDHLDALDDEARRIGAVNTIVRDASGRLFGHNTDAAGFMEPLRPLLDDRPYCFAYVIGTGGAAKAIVDALFHAEFLIYSISRDPDRARRELGDYLGPDEDFLISLDDLEQGPPRPPDTEVLSVIVNATPLGMTGHPPLVLGWGGFHADAIAYDIVTSPADTAFLREARAYGLRTIDGLAMLVGQAAIAFERFFGRPAPREHDAELRALLAA